ncbi:Olfactory receptor 5G3, partial [Varanus komodoensis]
MSSRTIAILEMGTQALCHKGHAARVLTQVYCHLLQLFLASQDDSNQTLNIEIILLGFQNLYHPMAFIFLTFLVINILTIAWNLLIIILILTDPCLHTPMYFFLGNLSCLETCYTSIVIPPMLLGLLKERKHLSLLGCLVQAYFFGSFAAAECFLLVAMAYDGYLAICCPLHY